MANPLNEVLRMTLAPPEPYLKGTASFAANYLSLTRIWNMCSAVNRQQPHAVFVAYLHSDQSALRKSCADALLSSIAMGSGSRECQGRPRPWGKKQVATKKGGGGSKQKRMEPSGFEPETSTKLVSPKRLAKIARYQLRHSPFRCWPAKKQSTICCNTHPILAYIRRRHNDNYVDPLRSAN